MTTYSRDTPRIPVIWKRTMNSVEARKEVVNDINEDTLVGVL